MKFGYPEIKTITPGLSGFFLIDNDAYHAGLGVSSTKVKKAIKSYAEFSALEQIDSKALKFGRAFHTLLLEPHCFNQRYAVAPEIAGSPASKAYKQLFSAWVTGESRGREILKACDKDRLDSMAKVVIKHPDYQWLTRFDAEVMGITTCDITGLQLKCKVDLFGDAVDHRPQWNLSGLTGGDQTLDAHVIVAKRVACGIGAARDIAVARRERRRRIGDDDGRENCRLRLHFALVSRSPAPR